MSICSGRYSTWGERPAPIVVPTVTASITAKKTTMVTRNGSRLGKLTPVTGSPMRIRNHR
jgi:hypothetical protein